MTHQLRYAARTDRGLLRANNQDSVFAGDRLLIIADGMGGHAAGDVASRLVVSAFMPLDELPLGTQMRRPLVDATREGNAAIAEMVDENPEFDGMGTTLTALLFDGPQVALAHVGDSRAYLYRNGVLHQISHDDTFVQSLVDEGRITADEAAHHPQRSLLLRALNGSDMDPSITLREISPGDRFLICSDGLSDYVSAESIADTLTGDDPDQVADTLIQLALVAGGPDNVTVIVADVLETGAEQDNLNAITAVIDPEATGPMQAIHLTQKFPRVPLPPIPEVPAAKPEFADPDTDEFDDEDEDDRGADGPRRAALAMASAPGHRRWGRRWAFGLSLVVLLAVALSGTYLWASSKYFVGADDGAVVVFQGVNGSLLGLKFASLKENSCSGGVTLASPTPLTAGQTVPCSPMQVEDLQQDARDQVNGGINVSSLDEARSVLTRLSAKLLPLCATVPVPTTTVPATTTTSASTGADITTPSGTQQSGGTTSGSTSTTGPRSSTVTLTSGSGRETVTSTVVVTVSPDVPTATESQRLRRAPAATTPPPTKTTRRTAPGTTRKTATPTRPTPTRTPTVTVTSTVTAPPLTTDTGSPGITLTSQSQEPGVNCRSPR